MNKRDKQNIKITDLKDMLIKTEKIYASNPAYKIKEENETYKIINHKEIRQMVNCLGTSLINMGLKEKKIAVIGENRYEWELAYLSIVCGTGIVVPLDKSLPENELENLIKRSKVEAIFYSKKYEKALKQIKDNKDNTLKYLISMDLEKNKKDIYSQKQLIEEGKKQVDKLNQKYKIDEKELPIFNFIYRERKFNKKENSYLGWERKRGMLNQFNEYILGNIQNPFRENTIENKIEKEQSKIRERLEKIKYIITLDADTDLILNSAFELIGAMAHILNKPVIDDKRNIVIDGYGIMQPRVGINLDISYKSLFTKIFAGAGGIDSYTNAISDIYQDNFKEGIFTGKGIYDVAVFSKVLKGQIPENTVLSHDLLEGCYLRCGLVSDIMLMDGYPTKYNSFMNRLSRWIRGDWQIVRWMNSKSPLNLLSK